MSYPRTKEIRAERRARAEERQAASALRSYEERLVDLDARGLVAKKERLKLAKKMAAEASAVPSKKAKK